MQVLAEQVAAMQAERQAHEAEQERQRRELQRKLVAAFTQNRAARVIQRGWGGYQSAKKKAGNVKCQKKGNGRGK